MKTQYNPQTSQRCTLRRTVKSKSSCVQNAVSTAEIPTVTGGYGADANEVVSKHLAL